MKKLNMNDMVDGAMDRIQGKNQSEREAYQASYDALLSQVEDFEYLAHKKEPADICNEPRCGVLGFDVPVGYEIEQRRVKLVISCGQDSYSIEQVCGYHMTRGCSESEPNVEAVCERIAKWVAEQLK